jgi:thymidylate kinase
MNTVKIAIVGAHGVGKSTICKKVYKKLYIDNNKEIIIIPEQFREIVKDIKGGDNLSPSFKQTEEITLATYAKQLYLENLYTAQGIDNILCDRSVLDTFVYYDYFNRKISYSAFNCAGIYKDYYTYQTNTNPSYFIARKQALNFVKHSYSKVYLIEPSDREIENDDFRMTDKKEQLEIHKLFLKYFKDFNNVVVVDQEKQDDIVEMICNDFNV